MSKFLLFFLTTYLLMHALFFLRIRILLPDTRLTRWISFSVLLFLILSPVLCRLLERGGYELSGRSVAFIGYYWMGFIFLGFAGAFCMGVYDALVWGVNIAISQFQIPHLSGKIPALILVITILIAGGYGIFEARRMKVEHLQVATNKLPPETDMLRIVQISDVHLGMLVRQKQLKRISEDVQALKPDILVCTGDLVDGTIDHIPGLTESFQNIRTTYGKYAVTGNHEYYAGLAHSLEFMTESGFTVLRQEIKTIPSLINIVGVDDHSRPGSEQEISLLTSARQNRLFTLLLRHRPDVSEKILGLFDLQLSGHTHGGQIFPFNLLVALEYTYIRGYYDLSQGSAIYVNRGSGTWGPQMRILSQPEITVIDLISDKLSDKSG